jgi:hypothetical protein
LTEWVSNMEISNLVEAIQFGRILITDHADEETENDRLTYEEIFFSVMQGEIIEEYPGDKPYPSCLVLGLTFRNEPVHTVWGYNKETGWGVLITVYRPDPNKWINWRKRRM